MASSPTPRGIRNNNPLNIRKGIQWRGLSDSQVDSSFARFETVEFGLRAAIILLRSYITGNNFSRSKFNTIEKIVRRWAPPIENATEKYIDFVSNEIGVNRYEVIRFENRPLIAKLVQAMAKVETGQNIPLNLILSAYDMI